MPPSSQESPLDDFFMPLQMDSTRALVRRSTPKRTKRDSCPAKSPRKRSIRFADEDRQLLEAVLLFEPDESFTESFSMMDESYESHSSFDSYEYANGGNCPTPSSVHILASSQDLSIPVNIVALKNMEGPSVEEIEQQVREEQETELMKLEQQKLQKRKSEPAKVLAAMSEPTAPVEVAQQKLKAEELRNAREEEKQQLLEQAWKEREEEEKKKQQQQQKGVRRVVSEPPKGTKSTLAQRLASFEQAAQQKQQQQGREDSQDKAKEIMTQQELKAEELRNAREEEKQQLLEQARKEREEEEKEKQQQQQNGVRRVVSEPPKGTKSTLAQRLATFEQGAQQKQQQQGSEDSQDKAKQLMTQQKLKAEELRNAREEEKQQLLEQARKEREEEEKKQQQQKGVRRVVSEPPKGTKSTLAHRQSSGKENNKQTTVPAGSKNSSSNNNNVPAWKQRDAELLQKAREEAALRQQRVKEEAESLKGAAQREKLTEEELTAARNAKLAQQKRQNELQEVGRYGKVGANAYSKRERGIVRVQAVARRFLVNMGMRRQKILSACVLVQRQVRGFLVRRDMAELQSKIANLEEHLKAMEEAKQEELKFIQNSPEIASLIDQLDDAHATAIRKQKELKQERLDLRNNIDSVKEHNEQIGQAMENLRINNRKIAKHTRMMEEQVPRLKQRIRTLERSQAQFQEKSDQWAGRVRALRREYVQANKKLESEARVADLAHATILSIREHVKEAAKTSPDPFLAKIKKRSALLERLDNGSSNGQDSVKSCPVIIMSR